MSKKKNRQENEVTKLRREVEVLKAQLKSSGVSFSEQKIESKEVKIKIAESEKTEGDEKMLAPYVRKSLRRSLFVSLFILTLIFALFLTQKFWLPLLNLNV